MPRDGAVPEITMWWRSVAKFLILLSVLTQQGIAKTVQTTTGLVRGYEAESRDARTYYTWKGIPYAEPPVGNLRFEPPVPKKPWSGILNANRYKTRCAQIELFYETYMGREDCLYLNVHVPKQVDEKSASKLPVMFGIHGGYFASGEARETSPDYFMDENIILVTPSYRLTLLGFLNTGDEIVPGNMGLKDLRLALKWVYENIEFFGGDPKRITVQGVSAGATAAHLMVISNSTREYVHKTIVQSGSALCPWALHRNPKAQAKDYGKRLGCPTDNSSEMVACMKRMDVTQLLQKLVGSSVLYAGLDWNQDRVFVPSIEGVVTPDTFLSDNPLKLLEAGDFKAAPMIIGANSGEGLLPLSTFYNDKKFRELFRNRKFWIKFATQFLSLTPEQAVFTGRLVDLYFGNGTFDPHSTQSFHQVTDLMSDRYFYIGMHDTIRLHAPQTPVYAYYYNKSSPVSIFDVIRSVPPHSRLPKSLDVGREFTGMIFDRLILRKPPVNYGVCHGDDSMMYTPLGGIISIAYRYSRDYKFSKQYVKLLSDFVSDKQTLTFQGLKVPAISEDDEFKYLIINEAPNSSVGPAPFKDRYLFWRQLLELKLAKST